MIPALLLLILGYDVAYYAINVLVWAHAREGVTDPVPLRYCLGIPITKGGGGKFMPPFAIGTDIPMLADVTARQLLGGEPWSTLLASAYDTGAGSIPKDQLPPELANQLDPDQTGILPRLPGEGVYAGIPGIPNEVL